MKTKIALDQIGQCETASGQLFIVSLAFKPLLTQMPIRNLATKKEMEVLALASELLDELYERAEAATSRARAFIEE